MKLDPYVFFSGTCEAAINDYQRILGGDIVMMSRYSEAPDAGEMAPEAKNLIMHARLVVDGQTLMASDAHPSMPNNGNHGFSLALTFAEIDKAERVFNALADGGNVIMPLQKTFWSERFGMLTDRYGIEWMINGGEAP
ncbi:VOC family protein [Pinirhizobacter sp.]|jgi:PhnB protein|uniref:VOC family protein n=1 Tax=Pinirhizobacter sp. TaxID=2950432 RepID=UPI002F41884F